METLDIHIRTCLEVPGLPCYFLRHDLVDRQFRSQYAMDQQAYSVSYCTKSAFRPDIVPIAEIF